MLMEMMKASDTHRWIGSSRGRIVKIDDKPHGHLFCVRCGRNFITDPSGERYAVYVGAMRFYRLADEVTERWCRENCPGQRLFSDDADNETRSRPEGCPVHIHPDSHRGQYS